MEEEEELIALLSEAVDMLRQIRSGVTSPREDSVVETIEDCERVLAKAEASRSVLEYHNTIIITR
jgi:hypothetical protein